METWARPDQARQGKGKTEAGSSRAAPSVIKCTYISRRSCLGSETLVWVRGGPWRAPKRRSCRLALSKCPNILKPNLAAPFQRTYKRPKIFRSWSQRREWEDYHLRRQAFATLDYSAVACAADWWKSKVKVFALSEVGICKKTAKHNFMGYRFCRRPFW